MQDCDCENDTTPAPNNCRLNNSDITISYFPLRITITFNPSKHESLEDLMNYNVDGQPVNLIDKLRTEGYDVIVINNPTYTTTNANGQTVTIDGGADYIERNAMTLVSYMQSIKEQQNIAGSTEKLVLIGPSMGGQITRYALAYMEKKFAETNNPVWQHNARLWVSVDSPHLGANIPVGAQANIWFLADRLYKDNARIQFYEELNSVAGKQQIISQFKNARETGYLNGNSFFTTYYNNLNSNGVAGSGGYPVSIPDTFRKIAMVNGSLTGKKDASEQQTFLYMRGYIRGLWPFQSSTITLFRLQDNFMPAYGQTGTVFKGDGQNLGIGLNHWNINHPRYTLNVNNNSIKGSLDIVPGGYFKTAKYIKEAVAQGASSAGIRHETGDYIENHSFIATFSALGHLYPNQNWGNPLNVNLTCPSNKQTPFDSYFGTANHTEHTSFTKESVDWLMKELDGVPQLPHFPIDVSQFIGSNVICLNEISEYSFSDLCKIPGSITWSLSGSSAQMISSTGISVTIKGVANGAATLTATFQNGQTFTKKIWVGKPNVLIYPSEDGSFMAYLKSNDNNSTLEEQGLTPDDVTWRRLPRLYTSTGFSCYISNADPNQVVEVIVTNSCGTVTFLETISFPPCEEYVIVSNNDNTFNLIPAPCSQNSTNNIQNNPSVIIVDIFGREVLNTSSTQFSLQNQLSGTYYARIIRNKKIVRTQTLIKR